MSRVTERSVAIYFVICIPGRNPVKGWAKKFRIIRAEKRKFYSFVTLSSAVLFIVTFTALPFIFSLLIFCRTTTHVAVAWQNIYIIDTIILKSLYQLYNIAELEKLVATSGMYKMQMWPHRWQLILQSSDVIYETIGSLEFANLLPDVRSGKGFGQMQISQ